MESPKGQIGRREGSDSNFHWGSVVGLFEEFRCPYCISSGIPNRTGQPESGTNTDLVMVKIRSLDFGGVK
jgi:hypothetical protein